MTAISVKVYKGSFLRKKPHRHLLEVLVRSLITVCTALSIVLSSVAVCDGRWLQTAGGHVFGLWRFCSVRPVEGADVRITDVRLMSHNQSSVLHCTTQLGQFGVGAVEVGMSFCRALVSLAVVCAIFGLELQVISRLSQGEDSARRWSLGSALTLAAAALSASGVLVFVALLRGFVSPVGFTVTFWCQFNAVFLFLLNGMAARRIHHMNTPAPASGGLQTC